MPSALERYVSDNALQFFGLSDKSIVDFVIASASSSKTRDALFSSLHAAGLPDTPAAHAFINEVHQQAPRKRKHGHLDDSSRKQAEKDAKALRKQQFSFVIDDD
ncbi:hypothetical protein BJV78DRAFT_1112864, partial [Lactifluus subvellereus]